MPYYNQKPIALIRRLLAAHEIIPENVPLEAASPRQLASAYTFLDGVADSMAYKGLLPPPSRGLGRPRTLGPKQEIRAAVHERIEALLWELSQLLAAKVETSDIS